MGPTWSYKITLEIEKKFKTKFTVKEISELTSLKKIISRLKKIEKITINQAKSVDKNKILDFINHHWRKNHILTKRNNIFNYYYK